MTPDRGVAILSTIFVMDGGDRVTYGGAERYVIQLCRLLRELGYEPRVWQPGQETHEVEGFLFQGLPWGEIEFAGLPDLNRQFLERTAGYDKAVYMAPFLAFPHLRPRSIVISHGVFWDYPTHPWAVMAAGPFREEWYRRLHFAATAADLFVSVDTNTLNWIRAAWPGHESRQVYIPNFVDTAVFYPGRTAGGRLTVLYPRRLDMGRGLDDAKAAARVLTRRYPGIEFHFVGRAVEDPIEEEMRRWTAANPRCLYYWLPMEEMPAAYRRADIVLIPTRASEGTSLSCLEAMACGKAVVAGRVGGLTDIVIDGVNGRLIDITPESLIAAVEALIREPETRARLGAKAQETAAAFSLAKWRERWAAALRAVWG